MLVILCVGMLLHIATITAVPRIIMTISIAMIIKTPDVLTLANAMSITILSSDPDLTDTAPPTARACASPLEGPHTP